jgi:acetyltransferase-like isoleucine patch superfamily enzyme
VLVAGPVKIGAHAVVGAGSVVRKDVEPYAMVAGNPARFIRYLTPPDARGQR